MSDSISRQDAINEIKNVFDDVLCCNVTVLKGLPEAVRRIEMMPSADRPTGWIPVSKRLPENNGCVLVTIDDAIEFGKYEDGEWGIWVCEHWDEWDANGVTAWMPLPEPYDCGAKRGGKIDD